MYLHHSQASSVIVFRAKSDIKPGQELFLNYGLNFFSSKKQTSMMKAAVSDDALIHEDLNSTKHFTKGGKCRKTI
jgi:hypothetical protein